MIYTEDCNKSLYGPQTTLYSMVAKENDNNITKDTVSSLYLPTCHCDCSVTVSLSAL